LNSFRKVCSIYLGWFSGDYFCINGFVRNPKSQDNYCTFGGKWSDLSTVNLRGNTLTLFDAKNEPPHDRHVQPAEEQSLIESLKVWGACAKAIQEGNYAEASALKSKIEEEQRDIRKKRTESGKQWTPSLFEFAIVQEGDKDGSTAKDPQQSGGVVDHTQGHWVYMRN
jgi:hypothetical protein